MTRFMRLLILTTLLVYLDLVFFIPLASSSLFDQVRESLQNTIEGSDNTSKLIIDKEPIYVSVVLHRFYKKRNFQPAWLDDFGPLPQVKSLIKSILGLSLPFSILDIPDWL